MVMRPLAAIVTAITLCDLLVCTSGFVFSSSPVPVRISSCHGSRISPANELEASGGGETEAAEAEAKGSPSSSLVHAKRKAELMRLILGTSMEEKESTGAAEKVDAIISELETLNQGFKEDSVDGEWVLCFTRNSKGSPSLQKALPGDRGFQNFDVKAKQFSNIVRVFGGRITIKAIVVYQVRPAEPNKLVSTIVAAGVAIGPVRIPLPLTGRVGHLEFTYQDSDIRVTRGNRGGLFLHTRPGSAFPMDSDSEQDVKKVAEAAATTS